MRKEIVCMSLLLFISTVSSALAGPAAPGEFLITNSDGSSFAAKSHGDEFQNWLEATRSGHTVIHNRVANRWEYAEKSADGTLLPSGIKVDPTGGSAPEFIEKGLKPPRDLKAEERQHEALKEIFKKRMVPSLQYDSGASGQTTTYTDGVFLAETAPIPVSGTRKLLVVLVSFADREIVTPASAWSDAIFNTSTASVARYYLDNSFGKLSITPIQHSQPALPAGVVSVKLTSASSAEESIWIAEAINKVAADPVNVDFTALDVDRDGIIDRDEALVYFIAAGYERSCSTQTPSVWGHATIYSSGGICAAGKIFPVYAVNGELNSQDRRMPMGVMVHELGHQLCGLPDLYDTSYYNAGLGHFSAMAGGVWGFAGNGDDMATRPVSMDVWSRAAMGWTIPLTPTTSTTLPLDAALSSPNNALKVMNLSYLPTEYWLAENRYPAEGSWDQGLVGLIPGYPGGLLITHVDNAVVTNNTDFNRYGLAVHQGLVPEQANISSCDMLAQGSANVCRGSMRTTFYSGNNLSFGQSTLPSSSYYSGASSGVAINAISACGPTMTASVVIPSIPDTTKPVVNVFTVPAAWNSLSIPVTAFSASDNVAVAWYLITASSTAPLASDSRWSPLPPATYTVTSTGSRTLYAWAKDAANNVSSYKSAAVVIDVTPPYISSYAIPTTYSSLTVPVTLTGYDGNKVIGGYYLSESAATPDRYAPGWTSIKPASYRFGSAGAHTLYAWVRDPAGNASPPKSATVSIDATPPTVNTFSVPPLVTSLTIPVASFAASDDVGGSGIGGYRITETATPPLASATWSSTPPASYTTSAGGAKILYAWAKDKFGGISSPLTATVFVDVAKPVVTAFTIPAAYSSLTVPITAFSATDNLAVAAYLITESSTAPLASDSRWQSTPPVTFTASTVGKKTLYAWAKDSVGFVSSAKYAYVTVDVTAPTLSYFYLPASYSSRTVPISWKYTDNIAVTGYYLSESSSTPGISDPNWKTSAPRYFYFTSAGVHTVYAWCRDAAGNLSIPKTQTVTTP